MMSAMTAALEFDNVSFRYPGAAGLALEGVSLRVEPGERLGVLGPNGGGKSTLLKIALGLLAGYGGVVRVEGRTPAEARRRGVIGYVAQRAEAELSMPLSVEEVVMLGATWRLPAWRRVPAEVRAHARAMMELVGVAELRDRAVGKLSGGQLQRALIARALAARPRLLVLDEPTVGIDAAGQRMFADLLARVHGELKVTTVVVSHDLRAVAAGSDRVACLARRLHSHGSPAGLTPQVLAEVFSHDVAGIAGLAGPVHLHVHGGERCGECGPEAGGAGGGAGAVGVPLRVDRGGGA
jgi:zinc transport system ATP-binding protein